MILKLLTGKHNSYVNYNTYNGKATPISRNKGRKGMRKDRNGFRGIRNAFKKLF
jgi:hypothetical protein